MHRCRTEALALATLGCHRFRVWPWQSLPLPPYQGASEPLGATHVAYIVALDDPTEWIGFCFVSFRAVSPSVGQKRLPAVTACGERLATIPPLVLGACRHLNILLFFGRWACDSPPLPPLVLFSQTQQFQPSFGRQTRRLATNDGRLAAPSGFFPSLAPGPSANPHASNYGA